MYVMFTCRELVMLQRAQPDQVQDQAPSPPPSAHDGQAAADEASEVVAVADEAREVVAAADVTSEVAVAAADVRLDQSLTVE